MRLNINNKLKYVSLPLLLSCLTNSLCAQEEYNKWSAFMDVEGKLGTKRHLGELDFFIPILQNDNTLLFTDIRYKMDNQQSHEGNFGLGLRHILPSDWIVGGYGYYDRRKSSYDNIFKQVTLGVEMLSNDWDFRANAYLPTGKDVYEVDSFNTAEISGTTITFRGGEEHSMKGYDAEIGWRVPLFDEQESHQVRLYAGGYRFYKDGLESIEGPRGRVELSFDEVPFLWEGARFTLGAETQRDDVRGRQSFANFKLRIPFSTSSMDKKSKLNAIEKRMTTPIVRDVDIVSQAGTFGSPEIVSAAQNGFTVLDMTTIPTAAVLNTALSGVGATTVIASGNYDVSSQIIVQSGQTLIGGGSMEVVSPSGRSAVVNLPTLTLKSSSSLTGSLVNLSDNSTLKGANLHHVRQPVSSATAISIQGKTGVVLENNTIYADGTSYGIYIIDAYNSQDVVIRGNTITGTTDNTHAAIGIRAIQATNLTVANNHFRMLNGMDLYTIRADSTTSFNSASINNKATNSECLIESTPIGSVGFTNISCP